MKQETMKWTVNCTEIYCPSILKTTNMIDLQQYRVAIGSFYFKIDFRVLKVLFNCNWD